MCSAPQAPRENRQFTYELSDHLRQMGAIPRSTYRWLQAQLAASRAGEDMAGDGPTDVTPPDLGDLERAFDQHLAAVTTAAALSLIGESVRDHDGAIIAVAPDHPEAALLRAESRSVLEDLIDALPAQEAALVRRHYLQGERFDEVAGDLNMSKSWASKLHARALQRLAKSLRARQD